MTEYPQIHPATQLTPIPHQQPDEDTSTPPLPPGLNPDDLPPIGYEPEYPPEGLELHRVCWLAGEAALEFQRRIEVVVNPDVFPPGYGLRFYGPPTARDPAGQAFSMMYIGPDSNAVKTFLKGMRYHQTLVRHGQL